MNLDRLTCALLNLPDTNDHKRLLGVPKGRVDAIAVESALRRRLAQIQVHPAGRSSKATEVRFFLQRIAADLMKSLPREITDTNTGQPELTRLDQAIIAVLIGDGGWNRKSRSRLVAVAATFNITVGGLMRILEALAESSRSGEGPLSKGRRSTLTMDRSWTTLPPKQSAINKVEEFLDQATKKFTPELRAPSRVMTIKLSILFGLLTVIAFILSLSVLLSSDTPASVQEEIMETDRKSIFNQPSEESFAPQAEVFFDKYPTFKVQDMDNATINAADQILSIVKELSTLSTSIRNSLLRGDSPSDQWNTTWNSCVDTTSMGWMHVNSATLRSVSNHMIDVLIHAELNQTFIDTLIEQLQLPPLQLRSPLTVSQRAWSVGFLARVSCEPKLSSLSRASARALQLPQITTCDEVEARYQALDLSAKELVDLSEFDDRVFLLWGNWISTVHELKNTEATTKRFLNVIRNLIDNNVDLSRVSNTRKVLGRILQETDWKNGFHGRDFVTDLYRNDSISSQDLTILGHLFLSSKNKSWFRHKHLVSSTDSRRNRELASSKLMQDWPITTTVAAQTMNLRIPAGFDRSFPSEWKSRLKAIQQDKSSSPSILAKLRLLNEASVSLWRGRPDLAFDLLDQIDKFDLLVPEEQQSMQLPNDGNWSNLYFDARSDRAARVDAIDTLYNSAATDLGRQDADTLASAALTQQSSRISTAATEAIVQQFSTGTNVAIAILNNLHRSRSKQQVAKLVANLTEAILPEMSDSRWDHEARRALVQHALTVKYPHQKELDSVSTELTRSLISETILIDPSTLPPSREIDTLSAIKMLVRAWKRDLTTMYVVKTTIEFNPTGVMQEYLQYQLQYLQLMEEEEARWRGLESFDEPAGYMAEVAIEFSDIVQQVTHVEMTIALHWDQLLNDLLNEYERVIVQ